jgi:serine/threonine protein kinase/formylglycine-generating enzyme required for sulfatase activity
LDGGDGLAEGADVVKPEVWQRVREIYLQALERPPRERDEWIERALAQERPEVGEEVRRMLAAESRELAPISVERIAGMESDPMLGRNLGGWILERELGRGGNGVVYAAREIGGERVAAIKVLLPDLRGVESPEERLRREAEAMRKLDHPGIVKVHAEGEVGGLRFLVQDLIDGRSLDALMKESAGDRGDEDGAAASLHSPVRCAELIAEVADALAAAHEAGVIHRDVKPQNILVDSAGRTHLVDFGLAKYVDAATRTRSGVIAGTPYYMSPEQARLRRVAVDHRTDIYSLGAVLYELLTRHRPFEGTTSHEIFHKILHEDPAPIRSRNPGVPRKLDLVCMQAMRREVEGRYARMADFAKDLRSFAKGGPVDAIPQPLVERLRRQFRRPRVIQAAVVALLAGGVASGISVSRYFERSRAISALPRVQVELEPGSGEAEVFVRVLEHGSPGPERRAGSTEKGRLDLPLDPGQTRIVVRGDDGAAAEFDRIVGRKAEATIRARPRRFAEVEGDWARVDGERVVKRLNWLGHEPVEWNVDVESFYIERACVSNSDYLRFLRDTGRTTPAVWRADIGEDPGTWPRPDWGSLPATGVGFDGARDYCEWSGARLPTAYEWELAARTLQRELDSLKPKDPGPFVLGYPAQLAGIDSRGQPTDKLTLPAYLEFVRPVRGESTGLGSLGLHHMFGNVSQWTSTPNWSVQDGDVLFEPGMRVIKGGDWGFDADVVLRQGPKFSGSAEITGVPSLETGFRRARSESP